MKLTRIVKPLQSVQVRVTLAGDLNTELESYARYYEHVHGEAVESKALIRRSSMPSLTPIVNSRFGAAPATTPVTSMAPLRLLRTAQA